jgi:predicted DNA-binding transcriptional regulator YafY
VDVRKIKRMVTIMQVLKQKRMTVRELSRLTGSNERSIYRDLKDLQELDCIVDKDFTNKYFIAT